MLRLVVAVAWLAAFFAAATTRRNSRHPYRRFQMCIICGLSLLQVVRYGWLTVMFWGDDPLPRWVHGFSAVLNRLSDFLIVVAFILVTRLAYLIAHDEALGARVALEQAAEEVLSGNID